MGKEKKAGLLEKWFSSFSLAVFEQSFHAIFLTVILVIIRGLEQAATEGYDAGLDMTVGLFSIVGIAAILKFDKLVKGVLGIKGTPMGSPMENLVKTSKSLQDGTKFAARTAQPFKEYADNKRNEAQLKARRDALKSSLQAAGLSDPDDRNAIEEARGRMTESDVVEEPRYNDGLDTIVSDNGVEVVTDRIDSDTVASSGTSLSSPNYQMASGYNGGNVQGGVNANGGVHIDNVEQMALAGGNVQGVEAQNISAQTVNADGANVSVDGTQQGQNGEQTNSRLQQFNSKLSEYEQADQEYQDAKKASAKSNLQRFTRLGTSIAAAGMAFGASEDMSGMVSLANQIDAPMDAVTDKAIENGIYRQYDNPRIKIEIEKGKELEEKGDYAGAQKHYDVANKLTRERPISVMNEVADFYQSSHDFTNKHAENSVNKEAQKYHYAVERPDSTTPQSSQVNVGSTNTNVSQNVNVNANPNISPNVNVNAGDTNTNVNLDNQTIQNVQAQVEQSVQNGVNTKDIAKFVNKTVAQKISENNKKISKDTTKQMASQWRTAQRTIDDGKKAKVKNIRVKDVGDIN